VALPQSIKPNRNSTIEVLITDGRVWQE